MTEATDYKLTEKQRRTLLAGSTAQARQGAYALHGKQYRELAAKGLARSKVEGTRRLYELTPAGMELAQELRAHRSLEFEDPRGTTPRAGETSTGMIRVRTTADEEAQIKAFVEREGGTVSDWVREGLRLVGALKRA